MTRKHVNKETRSHACNKIRRQTHTKTHIYIREYIIYACPQVQCGRLRVVEWKVICDNFELELHGTIFGRLQLLSGKTRHWIPDCQW